MRLIITDELQIVDTRVLDSLQTRGIEMDVLVSAGESKHYEHQPGDIYLFTELPRQHQSEVYYPKGPWFFLSKTRDTREASVALVMGAEDCFTILDEGWVELLSIRIWRLKYQADLQIEELDGWNGQPAIVMDLDLKVLHIGTHLMERTGLLESHWKGQLITDVFPALRGAWNPYFNTVQKGGSVSAQEYELILPDGSISWFDWQLKKEAEKLILVLVDVTEKVILKQKLEHLNSELDKAKQELQEFVYAASHDLKEPLRMTGNYVQLLEHRYKDLVDEDGKTYINYAVLGVSRMWQLIDRLLLYTNLATGSESVISVPMEEFLKEVIDNLDKLISSRSVSLKLNNIPSEIRADRSHLFLLFEHLITNAILYNDKDHPEVLIECQQEKLSWYFSVVDNGMGIHPRYHEQVFVLFKRLHGKNEIPGQGMGLGVCRKIVESMGGEIWLVSAPDRGTAIHFKIPR